MTPRSGIETFAFAVSFVWIFSSPSKTPFLILSSTERSTRTRPLSTGDDRGVDPRHGRLGLRHGEVVALRVVVDEHDVPADGLALRVEVAEVDRDRRDRDGRLDVAGDARSRASGCFVTPVWSLTYPARSPSGASGGARERELVLLRALAGDALLLGHLGRASPSGTCTAPRPSSARSRARPSARISSEVAVSPVSAWIRKKPYGRTSTYGFTNAMT